MNNRFFENLSIKNKLFFTSSTTSIIILMACSTVILSLVKISIEDTIKTELKNSSKLTLDMINTSAHVSIKSYLRAAAHRNKEIIHSIYEQYKRGDFSEEAAKEQACQMLASQQIGKTGYLYVVTSDGSFAHHPKLEGDNAVNFSVVQKQIKSKVGYLEYTWKNPDDVKGRDKALYMAYFEPWDWIISASSYKSEFDHLININDFRATLDSLTFGKTGYTFIIDTKGNAIYHPYLTQESFLDIADATGKKFIQSIMNQKNGEITYTWYDRGAKKARDKLAIFNHIKDLDWIVVSSSYVDEFYQPLKIVTFIVTFSVIISIILVLFITSWFGNLVANPLKRFLTKFKKAEEGDFSIRMNMEGRDDEIGQLSLGFNRFMDTLEFYQNDLQELNETLEQRVERRTSELKKALDEIQRYQRMQKQWISDISHEIRTPLTILHGELQAIEDEVIDLDMDAMHSLKEEVERLQKIVDDLHELTLAESGTLTISRVNLDPVALLKTEVELFKRKLNEKSIDVTFNNDSSEPYEISVDKIRLKQVFSNLLKNSLKYTDSPGKLVINSYTENGYSIFELEDTPPGVPDSDLSRLFDRLYRSDKARTGGEGGSGLGLAITKMLLELMDGEITAEKSSLGGLKFTLRFPII
ncbi:MAG: cache domain-containing protein [Fibrobacterales bacterium]